MQTRQTLVTFCIFTAGIRDFSKFHGHWTIIRDRAEALVADLDKLIETQEKTIQKVTWTFTEPKEFGTMDSRLIEDPRLIGEVVVTTSDGSTYTLGDIYVRAKSTSNSPKEIVSTLFPD